LRKEEGVNEARPGASFSRKEASWKKEPGRVLERSLRGLKGKGSQGASVKGSCVSAEQSATRELPSDKEGLSTTRKEIFQ